jgi:hypothetical protein
MDVVGQLCGSFDPLQFYTFDDFAMTRKRLLYVMVWHCGMEVEQRILAHLHLG